eukprot:3680599-Prymnesium_polylepis.3
MASASTPAVCHTPVKLDRPTHAEVTSEATSLASATSLATVYTRALVSFSCVHSCVVAVRPLRDARVSAVAPFWASQRAVSSPSPPVPPLRRCPERAASGPRPPLLAVTAWVTEACSSLGTRTELGCSTTSCS